MVRESKTYLEVTEQQRRGELSGDSGYRQQFQGSLS